MTKNSALKPFHNFNALDGYHCQSNSLAKIYDFYNAVISEEMLLGLGSGMSFIYWHQKGTLPFLGGRGNNKNFHNDVGERTGVKIDRFSTTSHKKAEKTLIDSLKKEQPIMTFVDMGFLPYFDFGEGYHFGGHTNVICGYDGDETVLVSDIAADEIGLKKGILHEMTLEQVAQARGSKFKPFPPQNAYFSFDFSNFRSPTPEDICASIKQSANQMLYPPIKNFGAKGIRKAGREIKKWEKILNESEFRMSIFNIYLFISVAGTGDGLFRFMYSRFLDEAAKITSIEPLAVASRQLNSCGEMWRSFGMPFKDALTTDNPAALLSDVSDQLDEIAAKEEEAFKFLLEIVNKAN